MQSKYKRILLKLSGEVLAGEAGKGLDFDTVTTVCSVIKECVEMGTQVGIVVGGGNFWRGRSSGEMDRPRADQMGMLATAMNSLCLKNAFLAAGVDVEVHSAIGMEPFIQRFNRDLAMKQLSEGKLVIFACGTGLSHFTTDTASALRALEVNCQALLKATKVNGVYTADPKKDPSATRFETISFAEVLSRKLGVMDSTAFSLCNDNNLHIVIFNFDEPNALMKILSGDNSVGTVVS